MDNTIQLYIDDEKEKKGYPITSPDRVVDENGVSIKKELNTKTKQLDTKINEIANKGTTVEVLERVTKKEIDRQVADGTIARLIIEDNSITSEKYKDESITFEKITDKTALSSLNHNNLFVNPLLKQGVEGWFCNERCSYDSEIKIDGFNTIKVIKNEANSTNNMFYQSNRNLKDHTKYTLAASVYSRTNSAVRLQWFKYKNGNYVSHQVSNFNINSGVNYISGEFETDNSNCDEYRIAFGLINHGEVWFGKPLLIESIIGNKSFSNWDAIKETNEKMNDEIDKFGNLVLNPNNLNLDKGAPIDWTINSQMSEYSDVEIDGYKTLKVWSDGSPTLPYKVMMLNEPYSGPITSSLKIKVSLKDKKSYPVTISAITVSYKTGTSSNGTSTKQEFVINKDGIYEISVTQNVTDCGRIHSGIELKTDAVECYVNQLTVIQSDSPQPHTIKGLFDIIGEQDISDAINNTKYNPNNLNLEKGKPEEWNYKTDRSEYSDVEIDGYKTLKVWSDGSTTIPFKAIKLNESYSGPLTSTMKVKVKLKDGKSYPASIFATSLTYKTGTQTGGVTVRKEYVINNDGIYEISVTQNVTDCGRIHACFELKTDVVECYVNQLTVTQSDSPQSHTIKGLFENIGQHSKEIETVKTLTMEKDSASNPLWGKIVSFNGDSICANNGGYGKIIATRNNMVYQNVAVGGGTIASETYYLPENYPQYNEPRPRHWVCKTISAMRDDADYIILEGGINDFWNKVSLGSITSNYTSSFDERTFCGAFESMLKQAILKWQGKKIGFVIVHKINNTFYPYGNSSSGKFEVYREKMIEMLNKWSIPYLDLFNCSGLNVNIPEIKAKYTNNGDGTHPNTAGYEAFYVPKIEAWMKTL